MSPPPFSFPLNTCVLFECHAGGDGGEDVQRRVRPTDQAPVSNGVDVGGFAAASGLRRFTSAKWVGRGRTRTRWFCLLVHTGPALELAVYRARGRRADVPIKVDTPPQETERHTIGAHGTSLHGQSWQQPIVAVVELLRRSSRVELFGFQNDQNHAATRHARLLAPVAGTVGLWGTCGCFVGHMWLFVLSVYL